MKWLPLTFVKRTLFPFLEGYLLIAFRITSVKYLGDILLKIL